MTTIPSPDRLLADTAWLRRLVRGLADGDDAADLQQDVALAWLANPSDATCNRSWFAQVARNLVVSSRRKRDTERRHAPSLPERTAQPSPDALVATAELQQRAVAAVLELPPAQRDTVLLHCMEGRSIADTAAVLGVPEETARTRYRRALATLRGRLAPERDRRGALLAALLGWSAAMKTKHVLVAGVAILIAIVSAFAFVPGEDATTPAIEVDEIRSALDGPAASQAIADPPATPEPRVQLAPTPPPTTATLTVRATLRNDGAPAAGVAVVCVDAHQNGPRGITDAGGLVRFEDLAPGDYSVQAPPHTRGKVSLAAGDDLEEAIEVAPGFTVEGIVVTPSGDPVPEADVLVHWFDGFEDGWSFSSLAARSDRSGRFCVPHCSDVMALGASHPDLGTSRFLLLQTRGERGTRARPIELRLELRHGTVRGSVVGPRGEAIANAYVCIGTRYARGKTDGEGRAWFSPPAGECGTDESGRFVTGPIAPGEHEFAVYRRGLAPHLGTIAVAEAGEHELAVVLHPGTTLEGTVRDESGAPVANAKIEALDLPRPHSSLCVTAADGRYAFTDLPPGEVTLSVKARGLSTSEHTFAFHGDERRVADLTLRAGARIRGRLTRPDGTPLVRWSVSPLDRPGGATTDADGRFAIADCIDADDTLLVRAAPSVTAPVLMRLVDITASEREQTFVVPDDRHPSARIRGRCVDGGGAPIQGVRIAIAQEGNVFPVILTGPGSRTAANGTFDLGPLPPGRYTLTSGLPSYEFAPVTVDLLPNEHRELGDLRAKGR